MRKATKDIWNAYSPTALAAVLEAAPKVTGRRIVPKFHLNIRDDESVILDHEGAEFPDAAAALEEGRSCARELVIDRLRTGRPVGNQRVEVVRDNGDIVGTVSLRGFLSQ